ncbi:regulator of Ty1 Transposition [Tilletia horrida]|nr:regulator of Ty1 Transposition [Tilletia horrida]
MDTITSSSSSTFARSLLAFFRRSDRQHSPSPSPSRSMDDAASAAAAAAAAAAVSSSGNDGDLDMNGAPHDHQDAGAAATAAAVGNAAAASGPAIFASVVYFINDDLGPADRAELKQILDAGGATPAASAAGATAAASSSSASASSSKKKTDSVLTGPGSGALPPGARFDPSKTTHVISASVDFLEYDACDDPQADELMAPTGKRACVVSSQWVRRSWVLGALQQERFFSADPSLFFSGIIVSCSRLPTRDTELISAAVVSCGGGYRDKLTREVTHLVAANRQGPKFAKLNAISDAQEQQLADAAVSLSSSITDEALQQEEQNAGGAGSSSKNAASTSNQAAAESLTRLAHLAKSQWNVKAVLPHWIDDSYRLFKLVDPKPYTWPLGDKAQQDGQEPIYLTDRSLQAPFGTTALKNASYAVLPGATIGSGALHNHAAATRAFQLVAQAMASAGFAPPSSADAGTRQGTTGSGADGAGHAASSSAVTTVSEALVQLALHAPENRGWPTFEEIAPAIKDSERLVVPVDAQGNEIQPGSSHVGSGPSTSRRARGSAAAAAAAAGNAKDKSPFSLHGTVLAGRAVLFGADVMMANPDRVYAFRTRIQAAGGRFVEPPEREEDVPNKVGEADIVVTKYRESRECLQALKRAKMCGSPQWLAFVLATGRISNPRHNLLHFPIPKDPIPAFSKFTITLTNYTGEARTLLRHLITCMGGKFTPEMTSANTHCIAASEEGEKVKRAKEWGIPVLNHIWLETCFTRWQAIDVLQTRFTEFGPAIRYGRQVLVDARLEDGVLEPWIQRAFEDPEAERARLAVEEEIVAKRQAAEEDARAVALGLQKVSAKAARAGKRGDDEEDEVAGAGATKESSTKRSAARQSSRGGASAAAALSKQHLADASIMDEGGADDSMLSTRSSRERKPTKKAESAAEQQPSAPVQPPPARPKPTRKLPSAATNGAGNNSDDDEMDVDAVVGGGSTAVATTTTRSGRVLSSDGNGNGAGIDTPTSSLSQSQSQNGKGRGPSVKRGSGAGPASRVPERKSISDIGKAAGSSAATTNGGGGGATKRGRDLLEEGDSEDSMDDNAAGGGSGRVRQSRRQKTSPEQKMKTITAVPKGPRTSSAQSSLRADAAASKRNPEAILYATTGVSVSDADAKLLKTLGAQRTEDMFKATHLVAAGLSRTEKMLCAIARGNVMIVDQAWLQMSVRKKALQEESNFPIQDPKSERKYGIKLEDALERSRAKPGKLLRKHEFYMTRNVKPAADVLRKVILAAGGSAPAVLPNVEKLEEDRAHMHLISCEEDKALWRDFAKEREPVRVYEAELIIAGVLKQQMEWDRHRLL